MQALNIIMFDSNKLDGFLGKRMKKNVEPNPIFPYKINLQAFDCKDLFFCGHAVDEMYAFDSCDQKAFYLIFKRDTSIKTSLDQFAEEKFYESSFEIPDWKVNSSTSKWRKASFDIYLSNPFQKIKYRNTNLLIITNCAYKDLFVFNK